MRKVIIPILAVLVVGVATIASAQTDDGTTSGEAQEENEERGEGRGRGHLLVGVLEDLVGDETITQEQSDAIIVALEEARDSAREARQELRAQIQGFWEDDVLTSEEIAELPHAERFEDPDGPFADALADGQITKAEMEEVKGGGSDRDGRHFRGKRDGHGPRWSARQGGEAA